MRKRASLLLFLVFALCISSCEKKGHVYCELSLPLPDTFEERAQTEDEKLFDIVWSDGGATVAVLRLSYEACAETEIPTMLSPSGIAVYYSYKTLGREVPVEKEGDIAYYIYDSTDGYKIMPTFYTSKYAYLIVTYLCRKDDFSARKEEFLSYAKNASFVQ